MKKSFREMLEEEFQRIKLKNEKFSSRAFAKKIGMSPTHLSQYLSGKKNISYETAVMIARRLKLSEIDFKEFSIKNKKQQKNSLIDKTREFEKGTRLNHVVLDIDIIKSISSWHHWAILVLIQTDICKHTPSEIAKTLGLSLVSAQRAIDRICRLGLARFENGKIVPSHKALTTPSDIASGAIKNLHRQTLDLAQGALLDQDPSEREFSCYFVSSDTEKFNDFKNELRKLTANFCDRFENVENHNAVYCFQSQLFKIC